MRPRLASPALRLAVALSLGIPALLPGQLVRGTVRDAASGAPLAGVVVSLHRAGSPPSDGTRIAATLSEATGGYALAPNDTGQFVVAAKRIGVRQYQSPPFTLSAGETRLLDIALEGVRFDLPTVTVSGATLCDTRGNDRGRIAALWEEARTALTASALSLRDRLFRASITRYHRTLEPRTLNVRHETLDVRRGLTEHAFVSFPAESLRVHGYARVLPGDILEYFAPDERVLLSDSFVREHCFALARDGANGEVGIIFTPTRARRVTDIEGTIWLDGRSFELRRVAFRYTNFPMPVRDPRVGGEVQFARLERGAWYVSRWYMRVPRMEVRREESGTTRTGRIINERPVVVAFTEDGGHVVPDEGRGSARVAVLGGRVVDSTGRSALVGASVSLAGLDRSVDVARDGSFRIPDLLAGNYTLLVSHPDYARLGILAGEQVLSIADGERSTTLVQAIGTRQILRQLCGYDEEADQKVSMRIIPPKAQAAQTDSTRARTLHVTWPVRRMLTPGVFRTITESTDLPVDANGGVTVCGVPALDLILVEERDADGSPRQRWELRSHDRGLAVVKLRR